METEIRLLERVELPSDVAVKWESSIHRLFSEGVPLPLQPISDFLKDVLLNSPPGEWLIGKALGDLRQLLGNPVAAFWGDVLDGLSIGEAGMFFMTIYWVMLDPRALQAEREERTLSVGNIARNDLSPTTSGPVIPRSSGRLSLMATSNSQNLY